MTLFRIKNKVISLCKVHPKDKATTPRDLEMFKQGYKYRMGDVTKWEAIAYFKTREAGMEYASLQNWSEW